MKLCLKFILFIMLLSPIALAQTPKLKKWPKEMTKKSWAKVKSKSLKALAKLKKVKGLGSAMNKAKNVYDDLEPENYNITTRDLNNIDEEDVIVERYDSILKTWKKDRKKFFKTELAKIEKVIEDYRSAIGSGRIAKKLYKKSLERFDEFEEEIEQIKENLENNKLKEFQKELIKLSKKEWITIQKDKQGDLKGLLDELGDEFRKVKLFISNWKKLLKMGATAEQINILIQNHKDSLDSFRKAIILVDKNAHVLPDDDQPQAQLAAVANTINGLTSAANVENPDQGMVNQFEEMITIAEDWVNETQEKLID